MWKEKKKVGWYGIWKRKRYEKQYWIKKKKKKKYNDCLGVGRGTCILNSSKRVQWFCPATHKISTKKLIILLLLSSSS